MSRKCRVLDCKSDSRRPEDLGVTFHKIPFHADIRPKWLSLCRIPAENQSSKIIYVCSRHFRRNDFCSFKGTKYMLKQGVLPSMFPWTNDANKLKTEPPSNTSKENAKKETVNQTEATTENKSDTKEPEIISEENIDKKKSPEHEVEIKDEIETDNKPEEKVEKIEIKKDTKMEESELSDSKDSLSQDEFLPVTDFTQGARVEVTDFSGAWYPAKVLEVDYTENEVFIEFENSAKSNEWIPMDSKRLRQFMEIERSPQYDIGERVMAMWKNSIKFPATIQKVLGNDTYEVLFDDNIPLVLKSSKISKTSHSQKKFTTTPAPPKTHPSPLFAPAEGSKQDRRDRKRKLNVAELFNRKRPRMDSTNTPPTEKLSKDGGASSSEGEKEVEKEVKISTTKASDTTVPESSTPLSPNFSSANIPEWICRWVNGEPVGVPSIVDTRRSVIVSDPRVPSGWIKHFVCRSGGSSAGKWDTVFISPEGKKFRSKSDLVAYLEKEKLPFTIDQFDFSLHLKKARSLGLYEINENIKKQIPKPVFIPASKGKAASKSDFKDNKSPDLVEKDITSEEQSNIDNSLKIICENGAYKCPIEGCAKTFRKENLTQMHVKHYHPEYSKFIGSTPNVADLAYARTVGEPIEDFLPKSARLSQGILSPTTEKKLESTPKTHHRSSVSNKTVITTTTPISNESANRESGEKLEPERQSSTPIPKQKAKDSEIVKILTSETKSAKADPMKIELKPIKISSLMSPKVEKKNSPIHSTFETNEPVEKRESKTDIKDTNKPTEHKPSGGGIRTLLPVIRTPNDSGKKPNIPEHSSTEEKPKSATTTPKNPFGRHWKRRRNHSDQIEPYRKRKYTKHDYDYYADYHDTGSRSPDYVPYGRRKKTIEFNESSVSSEYGYQQQQQQLQQQQQQQPQHPKHFVTETGEVIKIVTMKQEEIINCTCGFMEEDGLMIQCELCLCWQHAYCNNIEREDQVPEKYICYICQNPLRMRASRKYIHDQDWLKQGTLATANFHAKDENVLAARFERLRKSHELTGNLRELSAVMHSLKVKLKIAENKDHPKFYLWSKPWPKIEIENNIEDILENRIDIKDNTRPLEMEEIKQENIIETPVLDVHDPNQLDFEENLVANTIMKDPTKMESKDNTEQTNDVIEKKEVDSDIKSKTWIDGGVMSGEVSDGEMISQALASEALANDLLSSPTTLNLAALTPSDIEKIQNTIDNSGALVNPCIPEPEAKIESDACRDNLIDNINQYQKLISSRMDCIEEQINKLEAEDMSVQSTHQNDLRLKETLLMMIRDLGKMRKLAALY